MILSTVCTFGGERFDSVLGYEWGERGYIFFGISENPVCEEDFEPKLAMKPFWSGRVYFFYPIEDMPGLDMR